MGFEDGSSIDGWMDRLGTLKDGMRTFFILSAAGDPFPLCFSASLKSSNTAKMHLSSQQLLAPLLALVTASTVLAQTNNNITAPTVKVLNGSYYGTHLESYNQDLFLGIPFAEPPVGELRFANPVALEGRRWEGSVPATNYAFVCFARFIFFFLLGLRLCRVRWCGVVVFKNLVGQEGKSRVRLMGNGREGPLDVKEISRLTGY